MLRPAQKITPFLWFDDQAEEAVTFYTSLFKNSKIESINRYNDGPMQGKVLTAVFQLAGRQFMALDGGPQFKFTEAISLYVNCESQEEVDYFWGKLSEGGDGNAQQCGWLKDKYGVSWQIIPSALPEFLGGPDPEGAGRAMEAMLQMKKIDVEKLRQAYEGR